MAWRYHNEIGVPENFEQACVFLLRLSRIPMQQITEGQRWASELFKTIRAVRAILNKA